MNGGHVHVSASGFGLRVIPKSAPYRFTLGPAPDELDVERSDGHSWLFARVIPHQGGYGSRIAEHTDSLSDVLDVTIGLVLDRWWLDTSVYRVPLPAGWTAVSADGPCVFDLVAPDGSLIFIQTPSRIGAVSDLRTPDQVIADTGTDRHSEWVHLHYVHNGAEWHQRHHVRRFDGVNIVITSQARADAMPAAITTQRDLVDAVLICPLN